MKYGVLVLLVASINANAADLSITASGPCIDWSFINSGETVPCTFTITNNGPGTATNVWILGDVPRYSAWWTLDVPCRDWAENPFSGALPVWCELGTLGSGEVTSVTFNTTLDWDLTDPGADWWMSVGSDQVEEWSIDNHYFASLPLSPSIPPGPVVGPDLSCWPQLLARSGRTMTVRYPVHHEGTTSAIAWGSFLLVDAPPGTLTWTTSFSGGCTRTSAVDGTFDLLCALGYIEPNDTRYVDVTVELAPEATDPAPWYAHCGSTVPEWPSYDLNHPRTTYPWGGLFADGFESGDTAAWSATHN